MCVISAGDVVLEEDLQLDCAPDGLLLLPRLPYLAGERLGNTVVDMLLVGDQIGGYRPSCLPAEVRENEGENAYHTSQEYKPVKRKKGLVVCDVSFTAQHW
jgi:hypothetical protein